MQKKLYIKRKIWKAKKGNCLFYYDSVEGDSINLDFEQLRISRRQYLTIGDMLR